MIRGTTPMVVYNMPFEVSLIEKIRIYFLQGNDTLITKTEEDCAFDGTQVALQLSEEETYLLSSKKRLETKARYKLKNGTVGGTLPKFVDVYETGGEVEILT